VTRMNALSAALYSAALSLWALPALALAQGTQPGSSPAPMDRPAPSGPASTNWLWIIAAIVVLAIVWWAVSSRRRGTTRT
jgi:hypothetical protein